MERFWNKVDIKQDDECWEWNASKNPQGYGHFKLNGTSRSSHRVSWELNKGIIPDGMLVLHHCDNPPCVNPNHLWLGTSKDNSDDKVRKGRQSRIYGENNVNSILTNEEIYDIIRKYKSGDFTQNTLADTYKVSRPLITNIVNGKAWKHINRNNGSR